MKVRAKKKVRVIDPANGRAISDEEFTDVDATGPFLRYWRRRQADGSIEVEAPKKKPATKPKE